MLVWPNAVGYDEFVPFDDTEQRWPLLNAKFYHLQVQEELPDLRAPPPGNIQTPRSPRARSPMHRRRRGALAWHPERGPSHATPRALLCDSQPNVTASQAAGSASQWESFNRDVKTGLSFFNDKNGKNPNMKMLPFSTQMNLGDM